MKLAPPYADVISRFIDPIGCITSFTLSFSRSQAVITPLDKLKSLLWDDLRVSKLSTVIPLAEAENEVVAFSMAILNAFADNGHGIGVKAGVFRPPETPSEFLQVPLFNKLLKLAENHPPCSSKSKNSVSYRFVQMKNLTNFDPSRNKLGEIASGLLRNAISHRATFIEDVLVDFKVTRAVLESIFKAGAAAVKPSTVYQLGYILDADGLPNNIP